MRAGRASAISTAPTIRRRGARRRSPLAVAHGLLGLWWPTNPFTARYRELDADPVARPRRSTGSRARRSGCGARALDVVGGWDERYFMYMEDLDLCWRLRRAGFDVAYEPAGAVTHVQGASTSRTPYRMLFEHHRSAWRFARRRLTGAARRAAPVRGGVSRRSLRPGHGRARLARVQARAAAAASLPAVTQRLPSEAQARRRPVREALPPEHLVVRLDRDRGHRRHRAHRLRPGDRADAGRPVPARTRAVPTAGHALARRPRRLRLRPLDGRRAAGPGVWNWPNADAAGHAGPRRQHERVRGPAQPRRRRHPHGARGHRRGGPATRPSASTSSTAAGSSRRPASRSSARR